MNDTFPKMSLKDVQTLFRADFFQNGMTYYDTGKVLNPGRYHNKLYAQVQGSGTSNYNVIITSQEKITPKCTCPAARRYTFCKHVAAVLVGWAHDPNAFVEVEQAPEFAAPTSKKARVKKGKVDTNELITQGLASVETLTTELVLSGLSTITTSRVEQVRDLAENLRTYKLRRLSTLLTRFAEVLDVLLTDKEQFSLAAYTELLTDIVITAKGVAAIQQGKLQDPRYMEELVGKTWGEKDLTPRNDLELAGVYFERNPTVDKFVVFSNYFVELHSGEILAKKFIIPEKQVKRSSEADTRAYAGTKLIVSEALQYPGYPPFRLKLKQFNEDRLTLPDIETLISKANGDFASVVEAFQSFRKDFFAPADYYVLLRPEGFYAHEQNLTIFDPAGKAFELMLTAKSGLYVHESLKTAPVAALFGKIHAIQGQLMFEPFSAIIRSQEQPVKSLL